MISNLEAALGYAERKIPVFPCRPLGKEPLTAHGFKAATTSEYVITSWWTAWPSANIAMPTGYVQDRMTFDVLDIDVRGDNNGFDVLLELIDNGIEEHALALVKTPSGGRHLYFKGSRQRSSKISGRMVDFKASGGYVLISPSILETGAYEVVGNTINEKWESAKPLNWKKVQELYPQQPFSELLEQGGGTYTVDYLLKWLGNQREGNRNNALHWAVCRAIEAGQEEFMDFYTVARFIGLEKEEAVKTINSAITAYEGAQAQHGRAN